MAALLLCFSTLSPAVPHQSALHLLPFQFNPTPTSPSSYSNTTTRLIRFPNVYCSSDSTAQPAIITPSGTSLQSKMKKARRRLYPGELEGISQEMRFVAMRLRKTKSNRRGEKPEKSDDGDEGKTEIDGVGGGTDGGDDEGSGGGEASTWQPSMKGFLRYLVDSELVFSTIERIVDESQDASYTHFKNSGLERSESIRKDLEWFRGQNIPIPEPSNPGKTYVKHLEELARENSPLLLCHFYNIYFSHIAGGQVIVKKVSERLLEGRELEVCRWQGDPEVLLKGVRDKLDTVGEQWPRRQKCKCLRQSRLALQYLRSIVRLIIM